MSRETEAFQGRVAVVTGGASGMGEALARALARFGAHVVVADRDAPGAERVATALQKAGGKALARCVDVARREAVRGLVEDTVSELGRLDLLFNNAGIAIAGEARDIRPEQWDQVIAIDLMGVIHGIEAAYPVMLRQRSGHIVNTASMAGLIPHPIALPYSTAKFGVVGLSHGLRAEAAPHGVRVTVVCPGYVKTNIFASTITERVPVQELMARFPFRGYTSERAAELILRGVARNRAQIVFPPHARIGVWLQRLAPGVVARINRVAVKKYHELRGPD